jgi:hypothetical protein
MPSWIPKLSRRLTICAMGIAALFILGLINKADVGIHIATICAAVAAADAYEKKGNSKEKEA